MAFHEIDPATRLRAQGFDPGSWTNGPDDRYGAHAHAYDKVLVVAAGSIEFGLPERRERVYLAEGDRLDLPAGLVHDARVGPRGVTCLEAHAPARTLPTAPRRWAAGTW